MKNTRLYGKQGENAAEKILEENGHTVLCRNYCIRGGEIDLITTKGKFLFFTEVKARRISSGERPLESVDESKRLHILKTADAFLNEYRDNDYICALTPQLCVVEIYTDDVGKHVKHKIHTDSL